jgi:hypothetical protein
VVCRSQHTDIKLGNRAGYQCYLTLTDRQAGNIRFDMHCSLLHKFVLQTNHMSPARNRLLNFALGASGMPINAQRRCSYAQLAWCTLHGRFSPLLATPRVCKCLPGQSKHYVTVCCPSRHDDHAYICTSAVTICGLLVFRTCKICATPYIMTVCARLTAQQCDRHDISSL